MNLVNYKNTEQNNRCFIIAPGPSIKEQDLKLLKGEIVFSMSGFVKHSDFHIIKPKYHIVNRIVHHLVYYEATIFIKNLEEMDSILPDDVILFADIADKEFFSENNLFTNKRIVWRRYVNWDENDIVDLSLDTMPNAQFLVESSLYIALYLGFSNIYVLGMDKNWLNDGIYTYFDTKKVMGHIQDDTQKRKEKNSLDSETIMNQIIESLRKLKKLYLYRENIFNLNANQNTYVDVFPMIQYETLMNDMANELLLIQNAKSSFVKVPSTTSIRKNFSSFYSNCFDKIISLSMQNKKYLIYGQGTFGKTIYKLIPDNIVGFIDHKTEQIDYNYDYIIISLLGREEEVIKYLKERFDINKNRIILI
jgi:hypothetical protein